MTIVNEIKNKKNNLYYLNNDISFTIQIPCMQFLEAIQNILNE